MFSSVVKMASIRVVIGFESSFNLRVEQHDTKIEFFHGDLEKEIYMKQLEGFKVICKKTCLNSE